MREPFLTVLISLSMMFFPEQWRETASGQGALITCLQWVVLACYKWITHTADAFVKATAGVTRTLLDTAQTHYFPRTQIPFTSLQWRNNGHDGVSNHQLHDCLLSRLFRRRSKKTSKLPHWPLWGIHQWPVNSPHKRPVTRKMFPFTDVII